MSIKPRKRNGKIRLFYGGSLIPGKGVDTIILALKQLAPHDEIELVIVGDGPELHKLQNLAESTGMTKYIRFAGRVRPGHMPGYLEQTDIVVMASYNEGRPNIIIEAMAAGRPVRGGGVHPRSHF